MGNIKKYDDFINESISNEEILDIAREKYPEYTDIEDGDKNYWSVENGNVIFWKFNNQAEWSESVLKKPIKEIIE